MASGATTEQGFPLQPTPFIGRNADLAEISSLLATPACRLLTLLGPGGIGKTRLAIELAGASLSLFPQGAFFVALQPIVLTGYLISAIADSVRLSLSGQTDPQAQLLHYLHDKQMLLVLDNFEHLLAEAEVLADLLGAAPEVKLLVTSREALNLQEEWLYSVQGLPFPEGHYNDQPSGYSAVRLFVDRAQRVRRDFSLEAEQAGIVRICQLVEGIPLALELAAAWTKSLTCSAIAVEIERNLAFLMTNLRNMPERHRSMQAVFDQSWRSLTEEERNVFLRLAVFRGGFRHEAAAEAAGASLRTLSALVDKSLLQVEPDGRYQIHELLRQFAEEQWGSIEEKTRIYARHCDIYAHYLAVRLDDILGRRQRAAVAEIEAELENVRAAWQWAIKKAKVDALNKSAGTLAQFYQMQSRYLEGVSAFENAAHALAVGNGSELGHAARVNILSQLGWFYIRVGRIEEAERLLVEAVELFLRLNMPAARGLGTDPRLELGFIACARGDYEAAAQLAEQVCQRAEAEHHHSNSQVAYDLLSRALLYQGHLEVAQQHAQKAYEATLTSGNRWFMAYCLNQLGNVAFAQSDYAAAQGHYEASYTLRKQMDDPEGMAVALNHLGQIALQEGNEAEAETLYQRSLAIFEDIADLGGLVNSLVGLGRALCGLGDFISAREGLQRALEIGMAKQLVPQTFNALAGASELLLRLGRREQGVAVLAMTLQHPSSGREAHKSAHQLLNKYKVAPSALQAALSSTKGRPEKLETFVAHVQAQLLATDGNLEAGASAVAEVIEPEMIEPQAPENEALVAEDKQRLPQLLLEPLTGRELEVLRLVATGFSNPEIAERLIVSVGTVKSHIHHIAGKLGATNRTQAVSLAREYQLL